MNGHDLSEGQRVELFDDRDEENPEYEIDPAYSSPDFHFSEEDPATACPEPRSEAPAPAWNHAEEGEN